jgi:peptidoglycan/LPS O-acetylase OafA/YrhL
VTDATSAPKPVRRGDIQGLRAIAVGLVLLNHAGVPGFGGGYVGVDVFFVVSGFLITAILTRSVVSERRVGLLDFYARRARRILPAASVTLLGVVLASWLAFGYIRLAQVLQDVLWAGLFGANIHFAKVGSDYFASDGFISPVQHFWSLAVEEQFYLAWPLLIAATLFFKPRRPLRAIALVLVVLCGASLAWSVHQTTVAPTTAYFSTFTRGWELGAGALLSLAVQRLQILTRGFLTLLSWAGVGLIGWSAFTYSAATAFPGSAAALPVGGTLLVLLGGIRPTSYGAGRLLSLDPLRRLGDISYSLYLVHWPVLMIPAMVVGHTLAPFDKLTLILLSLTLATLSYHWVETPFRTSDFLARRRSFALGMWPAAASLVLGTVTAVGAQTAIAVAPAPVPVLDPVQHRVEPTQQPNLTLAVERAVSLSRSRAPLPRALTPSPLDLSQDNWALPVACFAGVQQIRHKICSFGDTSASRTLVLIGDSHIGMWSGPIITLAQQHHWKVKVFLKVGCPPIDTPMWRPERDDSYSECTQWRAWALRTIALIKPDRIIATGYTQSPMEDPRTGGMLPTSAVHRGTQLLAAGMKPVLQQLKAITPDLTVLSDDTTLPGEPTDCLGAQHATLRTCVTSLNPTTKARNAAWKAATLAVHGTWVDTTQWLCSGGLCPLVIGNVVVYTDEHHLTRTFAKTLVPQLESVLNF